MIFRTFLLKPLSLLTLPLTALSLLLISGERISAQPIVPANDGTGTIVSPDGNTFNIQGGQLSADQANLFHSFQQFGLNPDQIANFLSQPNIRNILGRVVGGDPSIIQGLIRVSGGNTNLYLMNPSGIVFGPTARLDVPANFAATTATSIQFDREFFNAIGSNNYSALSGNPNAYVFSSKTGDIINAGELNLEPGKVLTLIANTVTNTGEISTEGGQVILASMPEPGVVRLSQPGQVLSVEYEVGDSAPTDTPISVAHLSEILNQTQDYDLGFTLNADGSVQLSVSPIKIAPNPGTTIASGSIDVSGETGGQVSVLGETIAVIDADIDASGTNLGGVIHIGGELQGQGTTPTAQRTVVDSNSILNVDAVDQGNGGEAIVWADGRTDFAGTISAKGGANGGDGGFVEVSGKDSLGFTGTVDTTATNGRVGTLLLDPTNITIVDGTSPQPDDSEISDDNVINANDRSGQDLTLSEGQIESLLFRSGVSLAATNNITIADLTDNTLGRSIGNLTITADADNSGAGSVTMTSGDTIAIGGNINLSGASLTLGGLQSSGTINLTASNGNASLNGFVSGNGVTLTSVGNITTSSGLSSGAGQNLSLTSSAGAIDTRAGSLSTSSSSGSTGNITLDAAGNIQTGGISTASSTSSSGTISSVNAGSVQITSRSGSIDTSSTTTSSSGNVSGGINSSSSSGTGGAVTLQAAQNVTVGTIDTGSDAANGGNLQITTTNGNIVLLTEISTGSNAPSGRGGNITFSGGGTIDASEEERVDDLDDYSDSYTLDTSSLDGFGGNVSLTAVGDIALGLVETSGFLGGGNISMTSTRGNVNAITSELPVTAGASSGTLNTGLLDSSSSEGSGGTVTLQAEGNVAVGSILSGSANGNGGNVTLTSTNGSVTAISTGTLTSSSGVSETRSVGGIVTGTAGSDQGGTITITAPGDIRTGWLLTGSPSGTVVSSSLSSVNGGGNVTLTSRSGSIDTTINVTDLDAGLLKDLGLTSAQAALASQAGGELGLILTGSQDGNGGTVDLSAAGDIRTGAIVSGSLNATGGKVALTSSSGSIDTSNDALFTGLTRETWLAGAAAAGLEPTDTIDFAEDLGFGSGTYTVDQLATILDGFSFRPGIITGSDGGTGADVTLTAAGDITTSNIITSSLSGNSGKIDIRSSGGSINGQEGVLLSGINADLLQSLGVDSDLSTVLGYLARPDVAFGGYITLSLTGNAGNITLNAAGDVFTNYLATSSFSGRPGNINIASGGNVRVGQLLSNLANGILPPEFSSLNDDRTKQLAELLARGVLNSSGATAGGNITVQAETSITTGAVNSSSTLGSGGDVLLDPSGDIEVYSINTQGGTQLGSSSAESSVIGGDVTIATQRYFRALGSFIDQNGITASISTAAPGTGGTITINHGGNGTKAFTIGVPLSAGDVNGKGALGALTTGDYTIFPYNIYPDLAASLANGNPFLIAPEAGYFFTERFGSIGVISVDEPICEGSDCTPPPPTCQELGTCPGVDTGESSSRVLSIDEARDILALVEQLTGVKPALIYISFESPDFQLLQSDQQFVQNESRNSQEFQNYLNVPDRIQGPAFAVEPKDRDVLRLMVVTSSEDPFLISVPNATRDRVLTLGGQLYQAILEQAPEGVYLRASQQLYSQLVAPIRQTLEEREVDNLVFIMDTSLRLLPVAALHDGQQYLVENYSVGLMPSINLTDTRFVDIKEVGLLAMGADTFSDEAALPSVPTELSVISELWGSPEPFLNDRFTLDNLRSSRENQRYGILHLATHGDFKSGAAAESYIRFGDRRVTLDQLRSLRLYDPTVELMVLSACRTAVGNAEAELGFAGLAHQAGVKTVLGSLWYVGDQATLGLMTSFYSGLRNAPIKAEALRQAQLAMLRGEVTLENGAINLLGKQFPLRPETLEAISDTSVNLQHPYAWSAFTMVGSPW